MERWLKRAGRLSRSTLLSASRLNSRSSRPRPAVTLSSRSACLNQLRTLFRARPVCRNPWCVDNQSRRGSAILPVRISTPIAARRLMGQGHDASVDLGAATAVPDIGMDDVGEIEDGGALGQVDHLALRRQQIDAVFDDIGAEGGQQGALVVLLVAVFEQLAHPGDLAFEARIG